MTRAEISVAAAAIARLREPGTKTRHQARLRQALARQAIEDIPVTTWLKSITENGWDWGH